MTIGMKETWSNLVLRHNLMMDLKPQGSQSAYHSTSISTSGKFPGAFGIIDQKSKNTPTRSFTLAKAENVISFFSVHPHTLHLFVEVAGYLRYCPHHLRMQERIWNICSKLYNTMRGCDLNFYWGP